MFNYTDKGDFMALSKIQSIIQKLSNSQNVKKVVSDIQNLSTDIQGRVQSLNTNDAVKKYKEIVKKVSKAENDLQKEVKKVVTKIKTSANEVEKNLDLYKKKANQQKAKLEKLLKAKGVKVSVKANGKPKAAPKSKAKAKKTTKKRATAKA